MKPKMGSHCVFGHLKHKSWSKERLGDSRPLKVRNWPNFLMCKQCATYCWKAFDEGYNIALDRILIGGLHAKLCAPKVTGAPTMGISRLPLGNLETKSHLDVAPVERCREYYKGEGGGFPEVRAVASLASLKLLVIRPNTKSVQTMH